MQFLSSIAEKTAEFAKENATLLLTAGGVVGTVATAVLSARGGMKYTEILVEKTGKVYADQFKVEIQDNPVLFENIDLPKMDKLKIAVPYLIPPVITGAATIAMIITSHRMSSAKIAGLAAAYGLAERNLGEYKDKVAEKLTGPKKIQIDDELAQDQVNRTPGHDKLVVIDGEVLCLDRASGRYFNSTMHKIQTAVIKVNQDIHNHGSASVTDFYEYIGLPETTWSKVAGFDMDNPMELTFSTAEAPGGRPCLTFEFKTQPKAEFGPKYN